MPVAPRAGVLMLSPKSVMTIRHRMPNGMRLWLVALAAAAILASTHPVSQVE